MIEAPTQEKPLEAIAKRVKDIPLLPIVVTKLLSILSEENHSLKEIVQIVENDVLLTPRILRVANSAAFARAKSTTTLSRAILQLGEKMVIGIAIGSCSSQVFDKPLDGYESQTGELWDHSLYSAIASREIAKLSKSSISSDLAFTAGLLHDIGKSVISEFMVGKTEKLVSQCLEGEVNDFLAAERVLIGTDHAEIGYDLACRWNLPEPLPEVIHHHHHPNIADASFRALVFVVHIGDLAAMMGGAGTGADTLAYKMDPEYEKYIDIDEKQFAEILLTVQDEFQKTKKSIFADIGEGVVK